jgi:hypothetical protein
MAAKKIIMALLPIKILSIIEHFGRFSSRDGYPSVFLPLGGF